ncbi:type 2 isopentenyl-diphosphate Delta-isomerase [Loigolactobacillus bifermentans]|uniref:Isopentenyl-diphosphate delta-isomerase n=1 Tax=Loigolactobacillus bifermentans DSM 20003 TaxID=1423726 RepID=A0A0R1GFC9_9LACO|nr:type 2 isopentenyl-diphosphate Delta-isomerase [Loigolactobacillus bifermentans]KRK32776.1 isopentenyl pyrophosphate isomerase [Loigolactobacillus bifermentans DSM 20003]QGG59431.1 type 2 isopentenyl-diphosphate Delta-isomerase [Loigolactobacillus bifermentans]
MCAKSVQSHRKDEHLFLAEKFFTQQAKSDFEQVRFIHQSLPESRLADVDLTTHFAGFTLPLPLYINAMTGGSAQAQKLNAGLAQVAAALHIPMATGSLSIALKEPETVASFQVTRQHDQRGLLFANLGADVTVAQAQQAIDVLQADALQLHLNAPQELVMPEGDQSFRWLDNLQTLRQQITVPIIVKEVGFGMSQETLAKLTSIGIETVDVSGRGGTNFIQIENERRHQHDYSYLADWGQSTVESLLESQASQKHLTILASGGIRTPLDAVKALRLGAQAVGMSGTILHALQHHDVTAVIAWLQDWCQQLRGLFALLGCHDLTALRHAPIVLDAALLNYCQQRHITVL